VIEEGLAELRARGPQAVGKIPRPWWAFEGNTEADCFLETERLVLVVEGKRREQLSSSTDWYPARNQLVRNLEAVGDVAAGRIAAVLLVSEKPLALGARVFDLSLPHLDSDERAAVRNCFIGEVSWQALCDAVEIAYESLPRERPVDTQT
jgi:hypothetical protein